MKVPAHLLIALAAVGLAPLPSARAAEPTSGDWNFRAALDGKPIGEHRFRLVAENGGRTLHSDASFNVKVLGISAYRYQHQAVEHWHGDCLADLKATTDDDGKKSQVQAQMNDDRLVVHRGSAGKAELLSACVMSFAYWNPAIQTQTHLLNAQSGKLEAVQLSKTGSGEIEVHGKSTAATRWRITGAEQPIDLWYAADGRWIGLDSVVTGGRKLSYRLD